MRGLPKADVFGPPYFSWTAYGVQAYWPIRGGKIVVDFKSEADLYSYLKRVNRS